MGSSKGPLRKIEAVIVHANGLFGRQKVRLECSHEVWISGGAVYRGRCRKCLRNKAGRISPSDEPMHRIPPDDEYRGMFEGLCMSCMGVTAEWRTEDGDWQQCDECVWRADEPEVNEAKANLNKVRARIRLLSASGATPVALLIMERVLMRAKVRLERAVAKRRS